MFLQTIAIILLVYQPTPTADAKDLLHLFRPKPDLPVELNDFLTDVQHHRKDFAFIRNVVKNRRRYENNYGEHRQLFEDDQETIRPNYEQFDQIPYTNDEDNLSNNFKSYRSQNRYSKYIHSPIRLQRTLNEAYPKSIQVHPNSLYGKLEREEPKYPENRYHTGYLVGIDDDDDYYQDLTPSDKKKREVEISIKSDGKLVKRVEEDENGPKSIVLNIKSMSKPVILSNTDQSITKQIKYSIPSLSAGELNKNNVQGKDIGVPINSIPVGNQQENTYYKPDLSYSNNLNGFDNFNQKPSNLDLDPSANRKEEMEKVQGILMDPTETTDNKPSEKYMKRQSEGRQAIENIGLPEDLINEDQKNSLMPHLHLNPHIRLESNQTYEIIEKSTHHILLIPVPPTTEDDKEEREEEAKAIGQAIAEEIVKDEVSAVDDATTQMIVIIEPTVTTENEQTQNCNENDVQELEIIQETPEEHHKELKRDVKKNKNKSKKIVVIKKGPRHRKHLPPIPKFKRKHLQHKHRRHRTPYYVQHINDLDYEPQDAWGFAPYRRGRQLLSTDYEFDPMLIRDVGDHQKEEVKKFQETKGYRKKFKSEGEYADEEDAMTSGTPKQLPIKKTRNQFAMGDSTTEANDDDYDYADLTDMEGEDEDIAYEEEDIKEDNLDVEEPVAKFNKNEHENDKLNRLQLDQSTKTQGHSVSIYDVLLEANDVIAGAHAHGHGGKKKIKNKKKPPELSDNSSSNASPKGRREKKAATVNRSHRKQQFKTKSAKRQRESDSNQKPLSDREKEDLFLRYNPDFQRWPRFIQSDDMYHELMRRRALENQRQEFVKRQEPTTIELDVSNVGEGFNGTTSAVNISSVAPRADESSPPPTSTPNLIQEFSVSLPEDILQSMHWANCTDDEANNCSSTMNMKQQSTVSAIELTASSACDSTPKEMCSEESANHSPVILTTVLPLIPETITKANVNISRDEFLDLNEILDGGLPKLVVCESFSKAKDFVKQGLRVSDSNLNSVRSNYNGSAETSMILNEMSSLIMKLKYHSTCQVLSPNLMAYVKAITKNPMDDPIRKLKDMDEIDFDERQSNYMFHTSQGENMQDKAQVLKELLIKFNNLPASCKERAEPVKEYIETHLAMIDRMKSSTPEPPQATTNSSKPKSKKEINSLETQMLEEGLKNQKTNANDVIEGGDPKFKRAASVSTSTSPEYGRLANAVGGMRNRRQVIERINELLGHPQKEEELGGIRNEESGFESPPVINF